MGNKKVNYKELCEEYEGLLDMKDEVIKTYTEENKFLSNWIKDDKDDAVKLRRQVINLKVERLCLVFLFAFTLIILIFK